MIKPTKEAFLKHDLYKIVAPSGVYPMGSIPDVEYRKVANKGMRFVYCETDRKDAGMGWFADNGDKIYRAGNFGFDKMSHQWIKDNCGEIKPLEGGTFKQPWDRHEV